MKTEHPINKAGSRKIDCAHYGECLAYTARNNWKSFSCEECADFDSDRTTKPLATDEKAKKLCKKCGEKPPIRPTHPYCSTCMSIMSKTARETKNSGATAPKTKGKDKDRPKPEKPPETANAAITVEFGKYADVLKAVESLADKEMRPVNMQIIYMLKKYLEKEQ